MKRAVVVLLLLAPASHALDERLQLALRQGQAYQLWQLDTQGRVQREVLPGTLQSPLGSLWKLFIFDYLVTRQVAENPYVCTGQDREEVYCCETGGRIERDAALVKSCSLYFSPQRWNITDEMWVNYWPADRAPPWLRDLARLKPDTQVGVQELLNALSLLPSRATARRVLLDKLLINTPLQTRSESHYDTALAATLGSRLRIKTWSWHPRGAPDQRIGGFAGWLSDGTPVWASGPSASQQVLERFAPALNKLLPVEAGSDPGPCVEVVLFDRYPVRAVKDMQGNRVSVNGRLHGRYIVEFNNGNQLDIESRGDLFLTLSTESEQSNRETAFPHLLARLDREEYIARVLDREAAAIPEEAAKALAVTARTYLQQNASQSGSCLQIQDSSRYQRVAPRPASAAAKRIANWTADLVLAGTPVTYHQSAGGASRLSWQQAKEQAARGWRFDAILAHAYPRANLASWDNPRVNCQFLPSAEKWLAKQLPLWREQLDRELGYQETHRFMVCRLVAGKPHVDRGRRRIYVRNLLSLQDRLDLTHEYLHLAFEAHPNGQDEHYVESLARHLLLE